MNQRQTGWTLILVAIALMAQNMADAVADLQNWHAASTPQFVAMLLKQGGGTVLAALGGKMLTPFGGQGS